MTGPKELRNAALKCPALLSAIHAKPRKNILDLVNMLDAASSGLYKVSRVGARVEMVSLITC